MDPMSLIGAGTSLVGGIMGAQAQSKAADENYQINLMNYMLANREREDQIRASYDAQDERRKELSDQRLGSTDPQGNRTYFIPGQGWVTDLSYLGQHQQDEANNIYDLSSAERAKEISQDMPLQRAQEQRSFDQNAAAGDQADAFQRMFHDTLINGPNRSLGNELYDAQARGINDGYNAEQADATRTAVRSGTPNAGNMLASLARSRANDLQSASANSWMQGRQMAQQEYNQKLGNLAQLANAFMGQSRSALDGPQLDAASTYSPASYGNLGQLESGANQFQLNDGAQQTAQAWGKEGGRFDYVQPDYGMADTLASFGGQLSKIGSGGNRGGTSSSGSSANGLGSLTSMFGGGNMGLF